MSWDYHQTQQTTATVTTNFLCRSTGKPCPNATEYGYCKQTVYNNCGAKMDGKEFEEPTINPCRGCEDYDGYGGCKSNGGCGRTEMDGKVESDGQIQ